MKCDVNLYGLKKFIMGIRNYFEREDNENIMYYSLCDIVIVLFWERFVDFIRCFGREGRKVEN